MSIAVIMFSKSQANIFLKYALRCSEPMFWIPESKEIDSGPSTIIYPIFAINFAATRITTSATRSKASDSRLSTRVSSVFSSDHS